MINRKYSLDEYESEIADAFAEDAPNSSSEYINEQAIAKQAAESFLKKTAKINIRLSAYDLRHLKQIAAIEGIPYQTLISSILHKFAARYTQ